MNERRLLLALLACATASTACADEGGVCDGNAIEVREPLAEPIAETTISCTGQLTALCGRPVVRLDEARCEGPQVQLANADRDDLFVGLTLTMDGDTVATVLAAAESGGDAQPFQGGWLQLYQGSLARPDQLSGELAISMVDGSTVAGRFSALSNP